MASAQEYAQWIVDNADKQGTDEFNTVAKAYEAAKTETTTEKEIGVKEAVQTALPAVLPQEIIYKPSGFASYPPTGLGALAKDIGGAVSPYAKAAVAPVASVYKAHPILAPLADAVGLGTIGVPPVASYNSIMGMADKYNQAKGAVQGVSQVLSESDRIPVTNAQGQPVLDAQGQPVTKPAGRDAYRAMQKAAPELSEKFTELFGKNTGGAGNNAVRSWLSSAEGQAALKANPELAAAAEQYISKVPGYGAQAMKVAGPLLRGAAKIAGPVGLGMNMYDAAQYAHESQLGQRLAQGQGRTAQQAFRQMNPGYGAGFVSNVSPDEAAAVLQNGSPRDIAAMGGQKTLDALIRQKAAAKALQPIAPTGQ